MKRRLAPLLFGLSLVGTSSLGVRAALAAEPVPMLELSDELPPPATRTKTLLLGAAVFGGFYGGAVAASYGWSEDPGASDLRIPLVGPWLKLGQTTLCSDLPAPSSNAPPCNDAVQVVGGVLSVISGIGQLGGLAFLLEGTFMRTRAPGVAAAQSGQPQRYRATVGVDFRPAHVRKFAVLPVLTPSTFGAVMTGSF